MLLLVNGHTSHRRLTWAVRTWRAPSRSFKAFDWKGFVSCIEVHCDDHIFIYHEIQSRVITYHKYVDASVFISYRQSF
jgi:hypothetical protein